MTPSPGVLGAISILLACLVDRLLGDPMTWPHPVVIMGWWINRLRGIAEHWSQDCPGRLRCAGIGITTLLVGGSGLIGWVLEQLSLGRWSNGNPWVVVTGQLLMVIALASALASRSLEQAVTAVLKALSAGETSLARQRLQWIVGRDTAALNDADILRAAAETAAENSVDGLFAPLFWMMTGLLIWSMAPSWPGPLSLAWAFKATSTLDSMLGYKRDRLRWLGTAGARLDDGLVWIPCRLVMLSLPLVSRPVRQWPTLVAAAERDGRHDPSPNAGRAEAIYAHCAGIRMGGRNRYGDRWVDKPILAADQPSADAEGVQRILTLTNRLHGTWLITALGAVALVWLG
ncbi:MAG: adenosylcobinamide-phosphate synthase CbiB [Synechococcus sp.]